MTRLLSDPTTLFFVQLLCVLAACQTGAFLARLLKQPRAIGEMVAGLALGPSLFGLLFPEVQSAIFPPASISSLKTLGQLGIALYLFCVGMGISHEDLRTQSRSALFVSAGGIVTPFLLGGAVAAYLFLADPTLFGTGVTKTQAILFVGAALSITAFPMLARILRDKGLEATPLGALVLTAAALDDAIAW